MKATKFYIPRKLVLLWYVVHEQQSSSRQTNCARLIKIFGEVARSGPYAGGGGSNEPHSLIPS